MKEDTSKNCHDQLKQIFIKEYTGNNDFRNYANQESERDPEIKTESIYDTIGYNIDTWIVNIFIITTYLTIMNNKLQQLKKSGSIYFDIVLLAPLIITSVLYKHTRNTIRHGIKSITVFNRSATESRAKLLWENGKGMDALYTFYEKKGHAAETLEITLCPVSGRIMSQPTYIIALDSGDKKYMDLSSLLQWVYQQSHLVRMFTGKNYRCPVTNATIPSNTLNKLKEDPKSLIDREKQEEISKIVLRTLKGMGLNQEQEHETGGQVQRPKLA